MYAYKVYNNFKIYRPLADKYTKWRNNLTDYDIQGYEQLPQKGDILFILNFFRVFIEILNCFQ